MRTSLSNGLCVSRGQILFQEERRKCFKFVRRWAVEGWRVWVFSSVIIYNTTLALVPLTISMSSTNSNWLLQHLHEVNTGNMGCSSTSRGAEQPLNRWEIQGVLEKFPLPLLVLNSLWWHVESVPNSYIAGSIYCWLSDFAVYMIVSAAEMLTWEQCSSKSDPPYPTVMLSMVEFRPSFLNLFI